MLILNIRWWLIFSCCYWGKKENIVICQKKLVLILFIENLPGLICVNNFRPMPILTWNEHKQYKELDTKNKKNTHKEQLQCEYFMDQCHPH